MPAKNYLLAQPPEPLLDDPVAKIANTWADHFEVHDPDERSAFIDNYVQRCKEHRFWTLSEIVDGERITLCRLGQIMLFSSGGVVSVKTIAKSKNRSFGNAHLLPPRMVDKIPLKPPHGAQAIKLIKILKTAARGVAPAGIFDAMTTFSKAFNKLVDVEMKDDAPVRLRDYAVNQKSRSARFIHPRRKFYGGIGAAALKAFIAQLNPAIVHAVRGVGCPSFTLYNWIVTGDIERRIQAVRAFPLLLPHAVLSSAHEHSPRAFDVHMPYSAEPIPSRLGHLVDAGEKLQPALSEWFVCSERTVNIANTYPLHHTGSALTQIGRYGWDDQLGVLLHSCGLGSRRPKSKSEWLTCSRFIITLPHGVRQTISCEGDAWASFLAGCPEWASSKWPELIGKVADISDVRLASYGSFQAVAGWSLKRLLKLSEQWHLTRDKVVIELSKADELAATEEDQPWPALFGESITHPATTVEIVELTVPEHLCQEAQAMHHCVDGYSDACYSGDSRIISFRKDGKSLATAEFGLKAWKDKPSPAHLVCRQLRGPRNAAIPESSPEGLAYKWLLKRIKSRQIALNVQWPNVHYHSRPSRMRTREQQIAVRMQEWLLSKYGIVYQERDPDGYDHADM